jgi:type I restriction-modification system DNA methylase subunit
MVAALEIARRWHNDYWHGSLKQDKETSREQAYNQDFFIKLLGYREKPASPYTFEPKASTSLGQLPDALLSHTDPVAGTVNIGAVVELKGASVPLDRPQQRAGHLSPVQQGFKYKPQYRNCPFVVVSNFYELRLYNDNQLDYERWTLDDLVDPTDDYFQLKSFYLLLRADNLTTPQGKSTTQGLLSDIRTEQETIGKEFYSVYRQARLELLRDLYRQNESVRDNIELGIEKAQKIIDRIVFACFAEDRGLLPENTVHRVVASVQYSAFGSSMWSTLKGFFEAIDTGSEKLEIPQGYNGGLFANDPVLNDLSITDLALMAVTELSKYNFVEDLSVNILGHIFEQSITDLEEIKVKVQESKLEGDELPVSVTRVNRRKQEGIFYTPDYVVRHIVENTLGAYLREHEGACKQEFKLADHRLGEAGYELRERRAYLKYQDILQNVKVLDPACGSGAFLVYAFDYLLAENQRVDAVLGGSLTSVDDYVRDILRNNLYGVDVNEESVEISKLSLWLKTAQKGKKLTALDKNISMGNSLIDDPRIVGDKAFHWTTRFPDAFANGGFDVVVGNPPYGVTFTTDEKAYLSKFDSLVPDYEIYVYFISLIKKIVKRGGRLGYIFPNTFLSNVYGRKYREDLFSNYQVPQMLDLSHDPTFKDASVRTVVMCVRNNVGNYETCLSTLDAQRLPVLFTAYGREAMLENVTNLLALFSRDVSSTSLIAKVKAASQPLENVLDVSQGLIPYDKYRGHDAETVRIGFGTLMSRRMRRTGRN